MADEQKTFFGQVNALATRVAQEIKALKEQAANMSTLVPKVGNRGALAGYETAVSAASINSDSSDANYSGENVTVADGAEGTAWTKTVLLTGAVSVTLGSSWSWAGGEVPTVTANSVLVLHWCSSHGIASIVSPTA